MQENVGT